MDATPTSAGQGELHIQEAKQRLEDMLAEPPEPVRDAEQPARGLLEAFERFAQIPVVDAAPADEDGDGVLAQFGTADFGTGREFQVDLTRQFIEPGEDGTMWQLSCALTWPPTPETDALGSGELWSFGLEPDDFFGQVRDLAGWAWAMDAPPPTSGVRVEMTQV